MEEIETIREWLDEWKRENREVEIRTVSGKAYRGHIDTLEREYFRLREHPHTYISVDKIESITGMV